MSFCCLLPMAIISLGAASAAAPATIPTPTPEQNVWPEQERILFVCIDPCVWQEREYDDHSTQLSDIRLPDLDTDQWCQAARAWGAKEILFVAKHTGGFCWWQTETTDYSVKSIAWKDGKGDVLAELAASCRQYGLNLGIYVYPGDESWGAGIGSGGKTRDPDKQEAYNAVFRQQLREAIDTAARYVPVIEVWFDGSCVIEVGDILKEHAPNAVIFQGPYASIRWVGNERGRLDPAQSWSTLSQEDLNTGGATARHSDPNGTAWAPLEIDTTLYDHFWFWAAKNEAKRKSLDELMYIYYQSAGQGAVLLLNSTPNTNGLIPEADINHYRAFGNEIARRFDHPLAQTAGTGTDFELDLGQPTLLNHVILMEDYWFGERIRAYVIEGWTETNGWQTLAEGRPVGRKRIVPFDDSVVSKLRLRVTEAAATPLIRQFAAYAVDNFRIEPEQPFRSAWRQCAAWSANDFADGRLTLDIDLTPFITEAGQWQVQFKTSPEGQTLTLSDAVLLQSGQASAPGMLRPTPDLPNTYDISRTAVITEEADIRLQVTLTTPTTTGIVLIRRQ